MLPFFDIAAGACSDWRFFRGCSRLLKVLWSSLHALGDMFSVHTETLNVGPRTKVARAAAVRRPQGGVERVIFQRAVRVWVIDRYAWAFACAYKKVCGLSVCVCVFCVPLYAEAAVHVASPLFCFSRR